MAATKVAQKRISMPEIKNKAKALGIRPGKMKKEELIRAVQSAEGNNPCFGTAGGDCTNTECCFIRDCR